MSGPLGSSQWMYASGEDYTIDQSLRFNDDDSPYLSWTPSSAGNRRTFTWSAWWKHGDMNNSINFLTAADDNFNWQYSNDGAGEARGLRYEHAADGAISSNHFLRDPSGWYHIMWVVDTTDTSPASNKKKMYVNGVRVDNTDNSSYGDNNRQQSINNNTIQYIGANTTPSSNTDGYLAEVQFIDGQALTPSSFGETGDYGEWKPIEYAGTYGSNGYYLDFADSSALGNDVSGNNNDWTVHNLTASDQVIDTPTNNFCTWNVVDDIGGTLSEGNLKWVSGLNTRVRGTMAVSSGKWYWETCRTVINSGYHSGIAVEGYDNDYAGYNDHAYMLYAGSYLYAKPNSIVGQNLLWGAGTANDVIQVALDMDNNKIWFGKNGTWYNSGNPATGANATTTILTTHKGATPLSAGNGGTTVHNFGQDSSFAGNKTAQGNQDGNDIGDFYYTPPTGFLALCTKNLPDVDVVPSEQFNTVLYTGNGSTQTIPNVSTSPTSINFQPDFVWIKSRETGSDSHQLYDAVRGETKSLKSDANQSEVTRSTGLTAFGTDEFTVGNFMYNNRNTSPYVAWNWKANGSGSSNTDGTINTTATSANVDAGFSIVKWVGNEGADESIGHGLSKAPEMIITCVLDEAWGWQVYNKDMGANKKMMLSATTAAETDTDVWADTSPTSNVFYVGTDIMTNWNGRNYIGYCFHSVDGYSKVGSYTGNANDDAPFVYTGFRPAWLMYKKATGAAGWFIHDSTRDPENIANQTLSADSSAAEYTSANGGTAINLLSNGFKPGGAGGDMNGNNETYIYLAFAETPFKYSNAR